MIRILLREQLSATTANVKSVAAVRMGFLMVTISIPWCTVQLFFALALSDLELKPLLYSTMGLIVLPLYPLLNPVLHTISTNSFTKSTRVLKALKALGF